MQQLQEATTAQEAGGTEKRWYYLNSSQIYPVGKGKVAGGN